jgi:hypothetical protein
MNGFKLAVCLPLEGALQDNFLFRCVGKSIVGAFTVEIELHHPRANPGSLSP